MISTFYKAKSFKKKNINNLIFLAKLVDFKIDSKPGKKCIATSLRSSIESHIIWIAAIVNNYDIALIDDNLPDEVIQSVINNIKPDLWIYDRTIGAINEVETVKACEFLSNLDFNIDKRDDQSISQLFIDSDSTLISFTSGTESLPKIIRRTIKKYVLNAQDFYQFHNKFNQNIEFCCTFPGVYLGGFYNAFLFPLVNKLNNHIIVDEGAGVIGHISSMLHNKVVDVLWSSPQVYNFLNRRFIRKPASCFEKVIFLSGTAPLHVSTRVGCKETFGIDILDNYALSETLFISSQLAGDKSYSSGEICPGVEVSLSPKNEILVKTPYIADEIINISGKEVLNNKEDSWFCTGDLGLIEDGCLSVNGRSKDVIIRGGVNISSVFIENYIMQLDFVNDAALVAGTEDAWGETLVLHIETCSEGVEVLMNLLKTHLDKLPARYKIDEVFFHREMPRTTSGKIIKSDLRGIDYGQKL